jgi:taurine dioxygenase
MTSLDLEPLSPALGAEVTDVQVHLDLADDAVAEVRSAWLEHQVLLFRNQEITDADLVGFSKRFGDLDIAPPNENGQRFVEGYPEILVISNIVENDIALGSLGAGESVWHTDMNYLDEPPTGSVLWGLEVPPRGGDTGFMNMYRVLDEMPADLRATIDGLSVRHDSSTNSAGYLREGAETVVDVRTCPGAVHPLIRRHPETGRDALYLGRRRNAYVTGMEIGRSEALLNELWDFAEQDQFYWHHHWRVGDVIMWDNRCTMHRRDSFDESLRRLMHRTQLKGCRPQAAA